MTASPPASQLLTGAPIAPRWGFSIRWHLALFGLGIVVPMLLVASVALVNEATRYREQSRHETLTLARDIADDLDRELEASILILRILSEAPSLAQGDFTAFEIFARQMATYRKVDIVVRNEAGQQIVNTSLALGAPLPSGYADELRDIDAKIAASGRPAISNLFAGNGGPRLSVNIPVIRDFKRIYTLSVRVMPEQLVRVLTARELLPQLVVGVVDGNQKLIARSEGDNSYIGAETSPRFQQRATGPEGTWEGLNRLNQPVAGAYSRTRLADWRVAVTIPIEVLDAPLRRSLLSVAGLAAVGLLFSGLLAVFFGQKMARPIRAVASSAASLTRGEAVPPVNTSVRELREVGAVISGASYDLRRQAVERERAEELLRQSEERVRMMTEDALLRSEERYRLLVDSIKDYAILMLDPDGIVTTWNDGAARIKGYRAEEIVGRSFSLFFPPEDVAQGKPRNELTAAAAEGRLETAGWRVRKNGELFWAEIAITPIYDGDGTLTGFSKVTRDVSSRQKAEQKFKALLEAAPDAFVIVDQAGKIVIVNSQCEKLFGYTRAELIGQKVEFLMPKRFRATHPPHRDGFFAAPKVRSMGTGLELYGLSKIGAEFPVEISLSLLETGDGVLVSSAIKDISERKEQERALHEKNVELELAVKELDAFSYSVSHDLRAPLRAVDGFSRILLKDHSTELDEEGRDYLQRVLDNAVRMGELVDDLLKFSRLSRQPLNKRRVDAKSLVEQIVADERQQAGERDIRVDIGDLPDMEGDAGLLRQVFVNLIGNAFKYTKRRPDAVIEIGSQRADGETVYFVRDNGAGFDMQYADKLFGVFTRLHRAEDFAGTGVGLAIVKRIVERHDGRIWADAAVDKGASFYFTIDGAKHDGRTRGDTAG